MNLLDFQFLQSFQFLEPFWFLAIFLLIFVFLYKGFQWFKKTNFNQICDPHLIDYLTKKSYLNKSLSHKDNKKNANSSQNNRLIKLSQIHKFGLFFISLLIIFALASPVWQKLPAPVFDGGYRSLVIVLDLSQSMNATDVAPSRLERAKFKIREIIKIADQEQNQANSQTNLDDSTDLNNESHSFLEIGLLVYSNEAYVVSPISTDTIGLIGLVDVLETNLMPSYGSRLQVGLNKANELLAQADIKKGNILVMTDSVESANFREVEKIAENHQIHLLAIGTKEGSIIPSANGNAIIDSSGIPVVSKIRPDLMQAFSRVSSGVFQTIRADNQDIVNIISELQKNDDNTSLLEHEDADVYNQEYYWFLLLAMLIFLTYFRKGAFVFVAVPFLFSPIELKAAEDYEIEPSYNYFYSSDWNAQRNFESANFDEASSQFKDLKWKASSYYKNGDYQAAIDIWKNFSGANYFYNQANAYVRLNEYQKAIEHYDKAIELDKNHSKAIENKKKVMEFLEQQKQKDQQNQQNQPSEDNQGQQNQSNQSNSSQNQDQNSSQNQSNSSDSQSDNQSDTQSDSQSQSSESQSEPNQNNGNNQSDNDNNSNASEQSQKNGAQKEQEQSGKREQIEQNNLQNEASQGGAEEGTKNGEEEGQGQEQMRRGEEDGKEGTEQEENQETNNQKQSQDGFDGQNQSEEQNNSDFEQNQTNEVNKADEVNNQENSQENNQESNQDSNQEGEQNNQPNNQQNNQPNNQRNNPQNNSQNNPQNSEQEVDPNRIDEQIGNQDINQDPLVEFDNLENNQRDDDEVEPNNQVVINPTIDSELSEKQIYLKQQLQRIEDNPGELLRRKFLYQYKKNKITPDLLDQPY